MQPLEGVQLEQFSLDSFGMAVAWNHPSLLSRGGGCLKIANLSLFPVTETFELDLMTKMLPLGRASFFAISRHVDENRF